MTATYKRSAVYVTLNVRVEEYQRTALEEYATEHDISLAEAARRAIVALMQQADPKKDGRR